MKKSILPLLLITALSVKAQQSVMFKIAYQPKTTYSINKEMKTNMTLSGSDALAALGGGKDLVTETIMNSSTTITTGARGADKMMPIKLLTKTGNMTMTMNGEPLPTGPLPADGTSIIIYGKYSGDNKLKVDSVAGQTVNDSLRMAMSKMLDAVQDGITFPDHPLKPGDTFIQALPFPLPVPGMATNNINMKINYKLVSITNNIAKFEFTENMDLAVSKDMNISGLGTGTLDFDIATQFFTNMTNHIDMTFNLDLGSGKMQGKGVVSTVDKVEIVAN